MLTAAPQNGPSSFSESDQADVCLLGFIRVYVVDHKNAAQ